MVIALHIADKLDSALLAIGALLPHALKLGFVVASYLAQLFRLSDHPANAAVVFSLYQNVVQTITKYL